MKNKVVLIFTLCMFLNFSSQAAVAALEELEHQRSLVEFKNSTEFERLSRESAKLLPQTLEENQHLTLFSLFRTRHYFFGMPNMVSKLCGLHHKILGLVDAVVTSAFLDPEFEEFWKIGTRESCYDSKILDRTKQNFEREFKEELTRETLKKNKSLLDLAFEVYSIFAPKLTLRDPWDTFAINSGFFRGWEIIGLDAANTNWIADGECRQEILQRMQSDLCLPLKSTTSHGIVQDSFVEVRYYFDPWAFAEPAPFQITLRKKSEAIQEPLKRFLYLSADDALRKRQTDVSILRRAWLKSSPSRKRNIYESAFENNGREEALCYHLGLLVQKTDEIRAQELFRISADQGFPLAFSHLGVSLKEMGKFEEARAYLEKGAEARSPHALFHLAFMLEKGEGGKRDPEQALSYLKESADLGNEPAAYEYAQKLYAKAYEIFTNHLHPPRETLGFISRLPKPL